MSRIIFPRYSDGCLLLSSGLESRHFFSSASKSALLTNAFLLGRGFSFSCSALYFYLSLDFSRFFFWNSSSDSLFLLGMVYVSCIIWVILAYPYLSGMVNIPLILVLVLNYTRFMGKINRQLGILDEPCGLCSSPYSPCLWWFLVLPPQTILLLP